MKGILSDGVENPIPGLSFCFDSRPAHKLLDNLSVTMDDDQDRRLGLPSLQASTPCTGFAGFVPPYASDAVRVLAQHDHVMAL